MLPANMGVPLVCVAVPTMLFALAPIAAVEAAVYSRWLHLPYRDAFRSTVVANLWSTLVGVPVVWLPFVVGQFAVGGSRLWAVEAPQQRLEAATLQAAWLLPYEGHVAWMIPAASLVFLLPFYLGSVLTEFLVLAARWPASQRRRLLLGVASANALSYLGLAVFYGYRLWAEWGVLGG